ncbi:MAG: PRC-barrel domain-containing protein [Caldilineales bacterium]
MQFKPGTHVWTSDGEDAGTVDRVIIRPDTKEVTHIVVRKGFLFSEDKVVPMSLVGPATADKVTLREDEEDLEKLPDFEESYYVPAEEGIPQTPSAKTQVRSLYLYPPVGIQWGRSVYNPYGASKESGPPHYILQRERNIPAGTIPLRQGARVIGSDGEHIGDIERVFTDAITDRATHLLISEGLILKSRKLIPTIWLGRVFEDEVHLLVTSKYVDSLPDYEIGN